MSLSSTITKLDFNSIVDSLKTHFKNSGKFNDYNFEGSALAALIDVLAYNTHYQALTANFALNEAFLDSAQLRASVVSQAKTLGYKPQTKNAATAIIDVIINNVPNNFITDIILPKYTKFTTTINQKIYTFYTLDDYTALNSNGYIINNVTIYEGSFITKKYVVDSYDQGNYPIYVIPDENLFKKSLNINIFDTVSNKTETYSEPITISNYNNKNNNYLFFEAPNGYFEIMFGDNVIGKQPSPGSVITVTYLKTSGNKANNANIFMSSAILEGYSLSVVTISEAMGGSEKESIDSIKFNAPLAFAAQDRAVTRDDFKSVILANTNYIESMNLWGGEDNIPPEFGTVFISIKPYNTNTLTTLQKNNLSNILKNKSIVTIESKFIDPLIQYIEIGINILHNNTILTNKQIENSVLNTVNKFILNNNFNLFNTTFRKSLLINNILRSDESILSADINIKIQRRFIPQINSNQVYNIKYTMPFANVTDFDNILISNEFSYDVNGNIYKCFLRNIKHSNQLEIFRNSNAGEIIVVDNAGNIDTKNGIINIGPFAPISIPDPTNGIKLSVIPLNENNIKTSFNLLLNIDTSNTKIVANKDV